MKNSSIPCKIIINDKMCIPKISKEITDNLLDDAAGSSAVPIASARSKSHAQSKKAKQRAVSLKQLDDIVSLLRGLGSEDRKRKFEAVDVL